MQHDTSRTRLAGLLVALAALAAACGGGDGPGTPGGTDTGPPGATGVSGVVVLHQDVRSARGDALGAPPEAWTQNAPAASFDRALSYADWRLIADAPQQGVTGADGSFEIIGLAPGRYHLDLTKTLDGNLVSAAVPFAVGADGAAEVTAEVQWGMVRATSSYTDGDVEVREVWGPFGNRLLARDGRVVEIGDPGRVLVDIDGDGRFEPGPCVDQVWSCDRTRDCGDARVCQCTASCPFCEDCGPPVCMPPSSPPPYRCADNGACAQPGDRCVCVASCPECDDCGSTVCVPGCDPIDIVEIRVSGPSQLIVGQRGSLFAVARLSDGTAMDVTHLVDWVSSDPAIVAVDSWGNARAASVGVADVTAVLGDFESQPRRIEVTERPALTRIHVQNVSCFYPLGYPIRGGDAFVALPGAPPQVGILPVPNCLQVVRIGGTIQFAALGEFGDGVYYEDITREVEWQVAPPAVGTVVDGLFTALQEGTAQLTAALDGRVSEPTDVRIVAHPTVVALSIYADNWAFPAIDGGPLPPGADVLCWDCGFGLTVLRGDDLQFRATVQYDTGEWADVTDRAIWRSSDPSVAVIDAGGLLTAVAGGAARVDATLDDVTSNLVDLRVVNEATLQFISAYPEGTDRVVSKGTQLFFRATGQYDVGLSRDVTEEATWASSDDSVGGFDESGVFTGRAAGVVEVWAELDGKTSARYALEVFATGELDYCDPDRINRGLWSDAFNRVVLESDCAQYAQPGVVAVRYTVRETQPHGGIFDPCLDLFVFQGDRRIRTLREEGCGEPFLAAGAPELDQALLKYQLLAFWDLKDDLGRPVAPGTYTIYGRFFLYYDPVVSIDVAVLTPSGDLPGPAPTRSALSRTPTPAPRVMCTPPLCAPGEVFHCPGACSGGCGVVCAAPTRTPTPRPTMAPGERDVTESWNITLLEFGLTCPAVVEQSGQSLRIQATCAGETALLTGSIDATGRFSATGSMPSLCPTLSITGTVGTDRMSGTANCSSLTLRFEGTRSSGVVSPTPTRTATAIPQGTPEVVNLTGRWTVNVPQLGLTCPAVLEQVEQRLSIEATCLGPTATLTGSVDETGRFFARGSFPDLCANSVAASGKSDNSRMGGTIRCDTLELAFEGTRNSAGPSPTPTRTRTPLPTRPPGELDLNGSWTFTIPDLGVSCPAVVQHAGLRFSVEADCAGMTATLGGSVDATTGAFSASGSLSPLCPTLTVSGTADNNRILGSAECDVLTMRFEGTRSPAIIPPTPTRTATPLPTRVPGALDLTGSWIMTVPELSMSCPAAVEQVETLLHAQVTCDFGVAMLAGTVDDAGAFSVSGSFPPLCPSITISGMADNSWMSGAIRCDALEAHVEGRRAAAP